jgi:hypothetical protein
MRQQFLEFYYQHLTKHCSMSLSEYTAELDQFLANQAEPRTVGGGIPKEDERRRKKEADDK